MMYGLPWFIIILPCIECDWLQIDIFNTENPQNGVAKLGLQLGFRE